MKKFLLYIVLILAVLQSSQTVTAQDSIGPWIKDYDVYGSPYVWTSLYDDEEFWSIQIAFSFYWGMMFALHIDGEYIQVWQPSLSFGNNYVVKPNEFNGKLMYLHTPEQINNLIGQLNTGDCPIKVTFYLAGEKRSKTFHYRYYPYTLSTAIDTFIDERL